MTRKIVKRSTFFALTFMAVGKIALPQFVVIVFLAFLAQWQSTSLVSLQRGQLVVMSSILIGGKLEI